MVCPSSIQRDHDPQFMITPEDDGGIMITGILVELVRGGGGSAGGQVWADSIGVPFFEWAFVPG
jgi:hypothetical protein